MRLLLIRHGAVIPPAPGAYYGGSEVPLSPEGEREARAAAEFLRAIPIDHIAASPLQRAYYGAQQIAAGRPRLSIDVQEGLREIERGRWVGFTSSDIEQRWPGDLAAHAADPDHWRGHGGESLGDLRARVLGVRDALLAAHRGRTVVIVSHMFPTRALLADALGLNYRDWLALAIPTASVSLVDYAEGRPRVGWIGHKPDGLGVTQVYPQFFR